MNATPLINRVSSRECVAALKKRLYETVGKYIPAGTRVARLAFPPHANVGDHALWLAQGQLLRNLGAKIVYEGDIHTYHRETIASRLGGGTVILRGGGYLGDLYMDHQRWRLQILKDFPRNRILQMPQSIHFSNPANLEEARRAMDAHPNLILLCREKQSYEFAKKEFQVEMELCPDTAFALEGIPPAKVDKSRVLYVTRTDKEKTHIFSFPGLRTVDWPETNRSLLNSLYFGLLDLMKNFPRRLRRISDLVPLLYKPLAAESVKKGLSILGDAGVVVTDRLHAHILSLLRGVPTILLANSYWKNRSFYDTWTSRCAGVRWADSPEEAEKLAEEFAEARK